MRLSPKNIANTFRDNWPASREERWALVRENIQILIKTTGILTWIIILVLTLLEIKRYYNIDLIPGYDSAFEQVYGSMRGTITKDVDDLK